MPDRCDTDSPETAPPIGPHQGGVHGNPYAGHRVQTVWAAVVIYSDGTEGLVSHWTFDDAGQPTGRTTFVASHPETLETLREMLVPMKPPPGGRFEWREFRA